MVMKINEIAEQTGLSRRAVKYYEEKGLLHVVRDANGYRNYSDENLRLLKEISVYRKLGIDISDIRKLLDKTEEGLLKKIYEEKKASLHMEQKELEALQRFMEDHDLDAVCQAVDYQTIGLAIQEALPGFYGYYFMRHFQPYLQIKITTDEQREAYRTIVHFWDHTHLKVPLFLRIPAYFMYRLPHPSLEQMTARMDETLQMYLHPSEEEYAALCQKTKQSVLLRNSLLKYHPVLLSQRRFMKQLQDCGYNDIFIPAMIKLSPAYREYHEALTKINDRICRDLGLYYNSDFQLVMKKEEP